VYGKGAAGSVLVSRAIMDEELHCDQNANNIHMRGNKNRCSDVHKVSETSDKSKWIVALERDDGSQDYYLFSRASQELIMLFTAQPKAYHGSA
jgi:hypothetical protein